MVRFRALRTMAREHMVQANWRISSRSSKVVGYTIGINGNERDGACFKFVLVADAR
jgi:hypothetical protein